MSYQKVIIVGYLGRDPELRYLASGAAVCNFSIATSRRYTKGEGQQVDETTWFRVTVWGKQAETVNEFLAKGRLALVEGRLNPDENGGPRIWTRQDGTPAASFEITAESVRFLGGKGESGFAGGPDIGEMLDEQDAGDIPF